jgi:hypothetical protein
MDTRRKTRKAPRIPTPTLRSVYGEVILRKGTVLYHTSEVPFKENPAKPMLFTSFHPSEWYNLTDEYVVRVQLKRDISLLFMISSIHYKSHLLPLLDVLLNKPGQNLRKMADETLACCSNYLKRDGFDGWLSSIEGKSTIEAALLNDMSIFEVLPTEEINGRMWTNSHYNSENIFIHKRWGTKYPISTLSLPATLNINKRYKEQIDAYTEYVGRKMCDEFAFQILISNATINYIDAPVAFIHWAC